MGNIFNIKIINNDINILHNEISKECNKLLKNYKKLLDKDICSKLMVLNKKN